MEKATVHINVPSFRHQVARKIVLTRARDRMSFGEDTDSPKEYRTNRSLGEYIDILGGMAVFNDSIEELARIRGENLTLLEVGVGQGYAAKELITSYPPGTRYIGVTLSYHPSLSEVFPEGDLLMTSAEVLRGVRNETIHGVIAVNSLQHSVVPDITIRRIKEVLVPGGVMKALVWRNGNYPKLISALKRHGLDFSVREFTKFSHGKEAKLSLIVARKISDESCLTAEEILNGDLLAHQS